jgi:hypothetical protein
MKVISNGLLTALAISAITAQAATVTWDAGGGDGTWTNGLNWDTGSKPAANDTVIISNGDTVDVGGLAGDSLPFGLTIHLTGGSSITNPGVFRLNGSTWTNGPGAALEGDFWDLDNAALTFTNGSSATMDDWEQKGNNTFTFKLGPSGFSALTPNFLQFGGGATMADATGCVHVNWPT